MTEEYGIFLTGIFLTGIFLTCFSNGPLSQFRDGSAERRAGSDGAAGAQARQRGACGGAPRRPPGLGAALHRWLGQGPGYDSAESARPDERISGDTGTAPAPQGPEGPAG